MTERTPSLPTQLREVISYEDDVFAWAYLDQLDGVLRYEAYVIGYDDRGRPSTLELVFEEGVLDADGSPVVEELIRWSPHPRLEPVGGCRPFWARSRRTRQDPPPLEPFAGEPARLLERTARTWRPRPLGLYPRLSPRQWEHLHRFCAQQEAELKRRNQARWTRRLRALGYDVIERL